MRKEFENLEELFPVWQEVARQSHFYGVSVAELNHDELLAMVGCVGKLLISKDLEAHTKETGEVIEVNSFSVT